MFRNRKNAKGREPKNTGREPGLKGTGSGRFKPPCPPPPQYRSDTGIKIYSAMPTNIYHTVKACHAYTLAYLAMTTLTEKTGNCFLFENVDSCFMIHLYLRKGLVLNTSRNSVVIPLRA